MKKIDYLSIIITMIFINLFTFFVMKNMELIDKNMLIYGTGFFAGGLFTKLLMEILKENN